MKQETILSKEHALVAVGQNILLLLVSRPTILLLLKDRAFQVWKRNSMSIDLVPSCRWSKYFVIVGLPTNNIVVAERQDISDLET
jgi:hypothetical protein